MWIVGIRTLVCTYVWPALLPLSRLTPWSFSTGLNSFLVTPGLELRAFHLLSKCSARHGACFHPRATGNISRKSAKKKKNFRVLFCKKVACMWMPEWKYEKYWWIAALIYAPSQQPSWLLSRNSAVKRSCPTGVRRVRLESPSKVWFYHKHGLHDSGGFPQSRKIF